MRLAVGAGIGLPAIFSEAGGSGGLVSAALSWHEQIVTGHLFWLR
jgi:hypothetical protein